MKNRFRKFYFILLVALSLSGIKATGQDRFVLLDAKLNQLADQAPGLYAKVDLSVNMVSIQEFIRAIASTDSLNVTVDPSLNIQIINNFSNVMVKDVFVFLCKKYDLDITLTGSIMSFAAYNKPVEVKQVEPPKEVVASYRKDSDLLSLDLKNDSLSTVAKKLTEITGKNFVYAPDLSKYLISVFLQNIPLRDAMDKIAFANGLNITSPDDNSFLFSRKETLSNNFPGSGVTKPGDSKNLPSVDIGQGLNVRKIGGDLLAVDAINAPLIKIIQAASTALKLNFYLNSDIKGNATINISSASFDEILSTIFKGTEYTFRNENGLYIIGDRTQEGLRETDVFQFKFRSVDKIVDFIPADLKKGIDVKPFPDLNSLILCGSGPRIMELKHFLNDIDRVVPVIVIEVMIADVSNTISLSTGIETGLGTAPTTTSGTLFPNLNLTLGSGAINNIISGINGMGLVNLGSVTPNFYATINALEQKGIVKLRSTPQLTTMNGHEATMSIGTTEYYETTQNTVVGTQNPQNITTQQYQALNADLAIKINPVVSGNQEITMDISVKQSQFTARLSPTAPPGSTTRNFQSIIRVKDGDMIILGGLDENDVNESGSGVPFLSRIPILSWFFSNKSRSTNKEKLTIFIRATVIY